MPVTVRELAAGHAARLGEALGAGISGVQREQIQRAAELLALASSMRGQAVDGEPIDLGELSRLEAIASEALAALGIAPPPATIGHVDLSLLSDADLDQLEALVTKAGAPGPAPEAADPVAELLDMNRKLNELVARTAERASTAEKSELMYRRVADGAAAECSKLRARLDAVSAAAAAGPASSTPPAEQLGGIDNVDSGNIVPLHSAAPVPPRTALPAELLFDASDPTGRNRGLL